MAWNKDGFRDYLESGESGGAGDENADGPVETVIGIPIARASKDGSRRSRGQGGGRASPQTDRSSPTLSLPKPPMRGTATAALAPRVAVYINDSDTFPDERIKAPQLRRFLQSRPDMAELLWECVVQEGLDNLEDDEDDEGL
jgi:hypothetical protein